MSTRKWRTLGGAAGLSTLVVVALGPAGQAWADGQAPAGNNGTVKINNEAIPNQDNDPHVGCSFTVSFYGYDAGAQTARLTFGGQAPTRGSGSVTLSAGWTTARRTSGDQLDQTVPVSFSQLAGLFKGVAPAHQGYHVKLTADVSGSQGADVKHKVFWIDCAPAAGTAAAGTSAGSAAGTAPSSGSQSNAPAPAPAASGTTAAVGASRVVPTTASSTPLTEVEGLTLTAPATAAGAVSGTPGTVTAPAALPAARTGAAVAGTGLLAFTGFRALGIAGVGSGLLAGGSALVVLARRRRRG
jgi:hypothetical protein